VLDSVDYALTGTFFCDNTTAQFFPLMPTDRMLAPVIALNAYSAESRRY